MTSNQPTKEQCKDQCKDQGNNNNNKLQPEGNSERVSFEDYSRYMKRCESKGFTESQTKVLKQRECLIQMLMEEQMAETNKHKEDYQMQMSGSSESIATATNRLRNKSKNKNKNKLGQFGQKVNPNN